MHGQQNIKYYGGVVQASSLRRCDAVMLSEGLPMLERIVSPSSARESTRRSCCIPCPRR